MIVIFLVTPTVDGQHADNISTTTEQIGIQNQEAWRWRIGPLFRKDRGYIQAGEAGGPVDSATLFRPAVLSRPSGKSGRALENRENRVARYLCLMVRYIWSNVLN